MIILICDLCTFCNVATLAVLRRKFQHILNLNGTKILTFNFLSCSTNSIASIIYQFLDIGLHNQLSIKHNGAYSNKHISLHEILQKGIYMVANSNNALVC